MVVEEPTFTASAELLPAEPKVEAATSPEPTVATAPAPQATEALSSPQIQLEEGQAAAARGDFDTAVRALRAAATEVPDHPIAPRACILLARIYSERLDDSVKGDELYRYVMKRYPSTSAAAFAERKLQAPSA
jgi:hypothetical protein